VGGLDIDFEPMTGQRQIIVLHIESVQTSCGFGVPEMTLLRPRTTLIDYWQKRDPSAVKEYWAKKNTKSIDGLHTRLLSDDA
jgi:hypothetical protein